MQVRCPSWLFQCCYYGAQENVRDAKQDGSCCIEVYYLLKRQWWALLGLRLLEPLRFSFLSLSFSFLQAINDLVEIKHYEGTDSRSARDNPHILKDI